MPARLGSSRLERKPLRDLDGRPLVFHVLERARAASLVSRVVLATDSEELHDRAEAAGFEVVRTGPARSGTHRCALALDRLGQGPGWIVNVQGDQPRLNPAHLDAAIGLLRHGFDVGTVSVPLLTDPRSPKRVKVVTSRSGQALYFSRAPIPHGGPHQCHVGVYAFSQASLRKCASVPNDRLASSEDLEQLAWLEAGITIGVRQMAHAEEPIDDEADLVRIREG